MCNYSRCCKRSQASIEYLFVYAWAFIAVLAVLAGLHYSGIIDPSKFQSEECEINAMIKCEARSMIVKDVGSGNIEITFKVYNRMARDLELGNLVVTNDVGAPLTCEPSVSTIDIQPENLMDGMGDGDPYLEREQEHQIFIRCSNDGIDTTGFFNLYLNFDYAIMRAGEVSPRTHKAIGRLLTRVY